MSEEIPITIIGGGAVGCAIAYELSNRLDDKIFLLERNSKIRGENQSSRNSGVVHAGIYYRKDTEPLKARFCVEGNRRLYEFCEEHRVPHKKTGKLVVATNPREEEYLDDVLAVSLDNGVPGVKRISGEKARSMEPNVNATSAIYVPTSGIIEPIEYVSRLHHLAKTNGVSFITGNEVINITPKGNSFEVTTKSGRNIDTFETKVLINAAGLYSDEIARMVNPDSPYEMDSVRGEAAKFYKTKRASISMNRMNVYPAPHGFWNKGGEKADVSFEEFQKLLEEGKITKTVGVHLTPTFDIENGEYVIGKTVTIGPTPTVGIGKEDYSSNLHPEEYYLQRVKGFFPSLELDDIVLHQVGISAKLKNQCDFVVERDPKHPNCINVVGINSPGLTASLAIANYVRELLKDWGFFWAEDYLLRKIEL